MVQKKCQSVKREGEKRNERTVLIALDGEGEQCLTDVLRTGSDLNQAHLFAFRIRR